MKSFTRFEATAAPLRINNIDTDMIIPKQFLKTIKRSGLGKNLFDEMRYTPAGDEITDFILNQAPYRQAGILIAGDNFGCGSSREHAPWALADFGIRSVIAPSFADIFFNNCFKNGMLPVVLAKDDVEALLALISEAPTKLIIDLPEQMVITPNGTRYPFDVDPFRKHCLLNGLDDIGLTLAHEAAISSFETTQSANTPWLYAKS
jgi:3-isopropylmalate/(R)-2-methylmalate dehydratase small subunit